MLYENLAWAPIRAAVLPPAFPSTGAPNRAALGTDLTRGPLPSGATPAGTAFWGEAFDAEWKATGDGETLRHERRSGGRTGSVASAGHRVDRVRGAVARWAMLGGALVIWLLRALAVAPHPGAARSGGASRARRASAASGRRPDPLAELDDEAFWWERV